MAGYRTIVETGRPYLFLWESEEAEIEAAAPVMEYPAEVWDGTTYGDYATECTKGNYIPFEFFVESIKTVVGAIVGDQLYGDRKGMNARSHTILVGQISGGKGSAIRGAMDLFRFEFERLTEESNADLLWIVDQRPKWTNVGALASNAGSEPGLYQGAMVCPRLLLAPPELDSLLSKTHIEGSGAALLSQLRELWDSHFVNASVTQKRKIGDVPKICYLSLLTSTQPETFEELVSTGGGLGTGLLSRWTLIRNDETRTVASLPVPNLRRVVTDLMKKIERLEKEPYAVTFGREAEDVLNKWWAGVMEVRQYDGANHREVTARLNIIVLRNALHLAWLADTREITAEIMRKATKLGDYQLSQRMPLIGSPTENPVAKVQQKIRKFLRVKGRSARRAIQHAVHADRFGTPLFNQALEGLKKDGLVIELSGARANQKFYALRKESE
jgi:hypothetical protein